VSESDSAFTVGSFECRVVPDGVAMYEKEALYAEVPPEELEPSLRGLLNEQGYVPLPYHPLLVRTADGPALIDAGAGPALAEEWGDPIGRLSEPLRAADVEQDDLGLVVISHAHPDHVGGLTLEHGGARRPVSPNARHVISQTELRFWTSDRVPDRFARMATVARLHLLPLERAGILDPIEGEQELIPGIRVIPTPGHTPGHLAISLSSGSHTAIFVADAVLGETNFEHPEWSSTHEVDRAGAVKTRRRLLDRAAADRSTVVGYHLWGPGHVERRGHRYGWAPAG
jgi:glyoxylase-like metal-dependent hydrolase (beta-lactamase superfamily II)